MSYGNIYVAQVALGANDAQVLKAFREAESYEGASLIIAYSHCIAHGFDLGKDGLAQQKRAVASGAWNLYRYDPRRKAKGLNPLQLDSKEPTGVHVQRGAFPLPEADVSRSGDPFAEAGPAGCDCSLAPVPAAGRDGLQLGC
jgi:pyruvate/2-oxoacid:ferredoxin oxidoreductase beta subunit